MSYDQTDFHSKERRRKISNSQPLSKGWCKFFAWSGSFILCGIFWGLVLSKFFGK